MKGSAVPVPTSHAARWVARAILIACFQVSAPPTAQADVIYEYTGNPFTFVAPMLPQGPGPPEANPFTTDDFVFVYYRGPARSDSQPRCARTQNEFARANLENLGSH